MVGGWKRKAKTKMSQVGRCWARRLRGSRRLRLIGWRHQGLRWPSLPKKVQKGRAKSLSTLWPDCQSLCRARPTSGSLIYLSACAYAYPSLGTLQVPHICWLSSSLFFLHKQKELARKIVLFVSTAIHRNVLTESKRNRMCHNVTHHLSSNLLVSFLSLP